MITRGDAVFPPRGSTLLLPGDHIFILIRPGLRPFIDCIFSHISQLEPSAFKSGELVLKGAARVHEISHAYGLDLGETKNITLDAFIRKHLSDDVAEGLTLHHAAGRFEVKAVRNGLAVAVQFTADSRLSES